MNKKSKFRLISFFIIFISLTAISTLVASAQTEEMLSRNYETGSFSSLFLDGSFGVQLIQEMRNLLKFAPTIFALLNP